MMFQRRFEKKLRLCWLQTKMRNWLIWILAKLIGGEEMAVIYAALIMKGRKEFHMIPEKIKAETA